MNATPPPPRRPRSNQRRPGGEPATARSALSLRLILSGIALPVFVIACGLFAVGAASSTEHRTLWIVLAVICAATALFAWIDLLVVLRRRRTGRGLLKRTDDRRLPGA